MKSRIFLGTLAAATLLPGVVTAKTFDVVGSDAESLQLTVGAHAGLDARTEEAPSVVADADQSVLDGGPAFNTQVRLGVDTNLRVMLGEFPILAYGAFEADLWSGYTSDHNTLEGIDLPGSRTHENVIRKGFGRVSFGPVLTIAGGIMTSQWGLGVLANDGARVWTPGSAAFIDPRGGDVVLRGLVATGPWTDAKVTVYGFMDEPRYDTSLLEGDEAKQVGGGVRVGDAERNAGIYIVHREVTAADGDMLTADVVDIAGAYGLPVGDHKLTLEGEAALVTGQADFAPNLDYPTHDVLQLGGAVRATYALNGWGAVLDAIWASGDQNLDDADLNAFKADPNYEMGLLLFRHVLAAQTGRAPVTAANPELVGEPAEDLDRIPSQGTVTNTLAFFPRAYWQALKNVELYGGPLFAFADSRVVDPLNTRLNGGEPHNALGGAGGKYLGTELDLGARARLEFAETILSAGIEGAFFLPGGAFDDENGEGMESAFGGRAMVRYQF